MKEFKFTYLLKFYFYYFNLFIGFLTIKCIYFYAIIRKSPHFVLPEVRPPLTPNLEVRSLNCIKFPLQALDQFFIRQNFSYVWNFENIRKMMWKKMRKTKEIVKIFFSIFFLNKLDESWDKSRIKNYGTPHNSEVFLFSFFIYFIFLFTIFFPILQQHFF